MNLVKSENFAFLAAGSNGYVNYRHQADICHAYKILIKNGYKPENIIVMAYDDIAFNKQNKFQGTLFNRPSRVGISDENVYEGCNIDYWKRAVHPKNFLNILSGNDQNLKYQEFGNGRVLKTTENDNIFVYFSDHGGPGLMSFPPQLFTSKMLFKHQLVSTFKKMHREKKYKKITFYLETCYSGSMFTTMPEDIGIYAVSAANATQPSLATYCPPRDNYIQGVKLNTCLGDVFSVNWMQNTEDSDIYEETLNSQYQQVKQDTPQSHVLQWGDLSFDDDTLSEFMAPQKEKYQQKIESVQKDQQSIYSLYGKIYDIWEDLKTELQNQDQKGQKLFSNSHQKRNLRYSDQKFDTNNTQISNYEIETSYYIKLYQMDPSEENYLQMQYELLRKSLFQNELDKFQQKYQLSEKQLFSDDTNYECYEKLINKFEEECFLLNEYAMSRIILFYNFCAGENLNQNPGNQETDLLQKIDDMEFCKGKEYSELIKYIKTIQDQLIKFNIIE